MTIVVRSKTGSRGSGRLVRHWLPEDVTFITSTLCGLDTGRLAPVSFTGDRPIHDCGSCTRYAKGNPGGR